LCIGIITTNRLATSRSPRGGGRGNLEKEIFSVYIQFIYELGGSNGITTVAMATMTVQDVLKIQFYGIFLSLSDSLLYCKYCFLKKK
jgi:hypothetical protein